ncbi:MAG: 23S ribosomal RNA methyltransferase Erm [Microgenomates group bacterium]
MPETEHNMRNRELWQSQNFLRRPEFVANLIERTTITDSDLVVEIGPGKGIITQQLAKRAGRVIAVEVDQRLAANLKASFQGVPNIQIVEADFLKWELPGTPYKVFSNIPFNMTADIVRKLTEDRNPPQVAYLIMQDKAAFRFIGRPKDCQTSILLKPWFEVRIISNIDRCEFAPVPNINAVLAEFRKREQPLVEPRFRQWFRDFVIYGYNQWQPTVLDAFRKVFSPRQRSIIERELKIRNLKPSDLTIEQWLKLFETFLSFVPQEKRDTVKGAEKRLESQQQRLRKWHRTRSY